MPSSLRKTVPLLVWVMVTVLPGRTPAQQTANSAPASASSEEAIPTAVRRWLVPQEWTRDVDGPIVSLGEAGDFDDTHLFAPEVIREEDRWLLWYCGSRGEVAERVFRLGLETSRDGRRFRPHAESPVFAFGDRKHSILTPTVLKTTDGVPIREGGRLRMWFSSTWFEGGNGRHTLHEITSGDGVDWSEPSPALLENIYAPTIVKTKDGYMMWYADVSSDPWVFRHAISSNGRDWKVTPDPVLVIDQKWERSRLFYPHVIRVTGGPPGSTDPSADEDQTPVYLMWYGSYWSARKSTTALGFAVSLDGRRWYKHPGNPVHRPDPSRPWESHYVTSHTVHRQTDGSFRMWYASRRQPPFVNKYFALNTALWKAPKKP